MKLNKTAHYSSNMGTGKPSTSESSKEI